jgi:outer membrane protein assembly factor BamB
MGFLMKGKIITTPPKGSFGQGARWFQQDNTLCWSLVLLLLTSSCAGLKLANPLRIDENDWPAFGKTQSRINATSEIVSPPLTLAWEHDITSGMGYGSPIIIDSVVIATNMRGELYAINANTGKRIGWVSVGDAIHGSPAIDGSVAYTATTNSRESLVAFDLVEGKVLWKKDYGDIEATPLLLDGKLFFGNTSGIFFCIDKINGEFDWRFRLPDNTKRKGIRSAATTSDSLVIFGAEDGTIYALDARYGTERWSYRTHAPIFASPAVKDGTVYFGNMEGNFFALNTKDGKPLWQFSTGASIFATASFAGSLVLIGTTGGMMYALRTNDGSMAWSNELNSVINSSAVVSGDFAYVGTLKKELFALRTHDGSVVWKQGLQGRIKTSPAVAYGKVFVATDDKTILAFTPTTKPESR